MNTCSDTSSVKMMSLPNRPSAVVRRARVELRDKPRLRTVLIAIHQPRHRNLRLRMSLVRLGRLEQLLERLVLGLILVVACATAMVCPWKITTEKYASGRGCDRGDGAHVQEHRLRQQVNEYAISVG